MPFWSILATLWLQFEPMLVAAIAETQMCGSPTRARTWDLRIDMASVVKRAQEFLPSKHHAGRASPIGEATGSSVMTVDQTDMRALVSRKTVVRHGAASL